MALQGKVFAAKPDNLSDSLEPHKFRSIKLSLQIVLQPPHTCHGTYLHTIINKIRKF